MFILLLGKKHLKLFVRGEIFFHLAVAFLHLVDTILEVAHNLLELFRAHLQIESMLHFEIDQTR